MIADRLIEPGTLRSDGDRVSVEVRMPWYRALPASCIMGADLVIDGRAVDPGSLTWTMNGTESSFDDLGPRTDDWWFVQDSAVLTGTLPDQARELGDGEHEIEVGLRIRIPYIVTDHGVLQIDEHLTTRMAVAA